MVRQYYTYKIVKLSRRDLKEVLKECEPPLCLVGGWAVHLHVNNGFREEEGHEYIGSRDIDLGIHVNPEWGPDEIKDEAAGKTIQKLEDMGYIRTRFGFKKQFHRETGKPLAPEEARNRPMHEIFDMFIDLLPDTSDLDNFKEAFGFQPPAETMLRHVFNGKHSLPLKKEVDWDISKEVSLPTPELLGAIKVKSLPDREKGYKRVKDLADLYAILWYIKPYKEIRDGIREIVLDRDLEKLEDSIDDQLLNSAANLLQVDEGMVKDQIKRLVKPF